MLKRVIKALLYRVNKFMHEIQRISKVSEPTIASDWFWCAAYVTSAQTQHLYLKPNCPCIVLAYTWYAGHYLYLPGTIPYTMLQSEDHVKYIYLFKNKSFWKNYNEKDIYFF